MRFDKVVQQILNEGKRESEALLAKIFPYDANLQNQLLELDQTPSKGDVLDIVKFYKETKDLNKVKIYLNLYYNLKSKNVPIKAPGSFKTFINFTEHVDAVNTKQKLKNAPIAPTIEHEDSADKLVDTDELTIFKGDSQHKCVKYGEGYTFCISQHAGGNMFGSYRLGYQSTFYFIFFKKIPKTNPKHIMVLDHTKDGWKWTFGDNSTEDTTWEEVVQQFPVLEQYENLFVNEPLSKKEKDILNFLENFKHKQNLKQFLEIDRDTQIAFLKSGITVIDEIFDYLKKQNAWNLINEYISLGPNLTPNQTDAVESKGGTYLNQYLKQRELIIPQLVDNKLYIYNRLDDNIPLVQQKRQDDYDTAYARVEQSISIAEDEFSDVGYIDIWLSDLKFLTKLPTNIPKIITGSLYCSNTSLSSLEGAPESVQDLICYSNYSLLSLKGMPAIIKGNFDCDCTSITSLDGAPKHIGGNFFCRNTNIISLKGGPESVGKNFNCSDNKLTSLEGCPESIGNDFDCSDNKLTSLEGCPKIINGNFNVIRNDSLTSLKGGPKRVEATFICNYNDSLTSLKGGPESVGNFWCKGNNSLTSLEGAPESVRENFECTDNESLISLKGGPKTVSDDFICTNNNSLRSLRGAPHTIGGNFYCSDNESLMSLKGMPARIGLKYGFGYNGAEFKEYEIIDAMQESLLENQKSLSTESFKDYFKKYYSS